MNRVTLVIGTLSLLALAAEAHSQVTARSYSDGGVATAHASGVGETNLHAEAAPRHRPALPRTDGRAATPRARASPFPTAVGRRATRTATRAARAPGRTSKAWPAPCAALPSAKATPTPAATAKPSAAAQPLRSAGRLFLEPTPTHAADAAAPPWPTRSRWPTPIAARPSAAAECMLRPAMAVKPSGRGTPWDSAGVGTPGPTSESKAAPSSAAAAVPAPPSSTGS